MITMTMLRNQYGLLGLCWLLLCLPLHAADIVQVRLINESNQPLLQVPFTFAQVFRPGDVPDAKRLVAKNSVGMLVPMQVDVKTWHADGSVRHALLSVVVPEMKAQQMIPLQLLSLDKPASVLTTPSLTAAQALPKNFDVLVELSGLGRVSLAEVLRHATAKIWLQGPLVTEWIYQTAVPNNPHLTVGFELRVYANSPDVRVAVSVENTRSLVSKPQNYQYDVHVSTTGKKVLLQQAAVTHFRQSRWRRVFWSPAAPPVYVAQDAAYLQSTGAVANYDPDLRIAPEALELLQQEWQGKITELLEPGTLQPHMPASGARPEIAPLPRWAVQHLLTQDPRALRVTLGNAEQAGSWPIHYRDEATGRPFSSYEHGDVSLSKFPDYCVDSCSDGKYLPDSAHQPSLAYYPYLITGDFYFLEELQFWVNWNVLQHHPNGRGGRDGLLDWDQIRGQAWMLRSLADAAYITPDDDALKAGFVHQLQANLQHYSELWLHNPKANALGINDTQQIWVHDDWLMMSPFMDDFFTWSLEHALDLGFAAARPLLQWKARFPVLRMQDPEDVYCWIFAAPYEMVVGNKTTGIFQQIADAYAPTLEFNKKAAVITAPCASQLMAETAGLDAAGTMDGYALSPTGFPSNMQPALAAAVNVGVANAQRAWATFIHRPYRPGVPLMRDEWQYSFNPQFAIVPRRSDLQSSDMLPADKP